MAYIGASPTSAAFITDQFNGTGSQTAFTMSVAPATTSSMLVSITGVLQEPSTYSINGTTLTFSEAPPAGTTISVRYLGIPASGVVTTAYRTVTEFTATAGQTTFSPPSYTPGFINVFRNGVRLGATNFTATNGTTVVLANAASVGDLIVTESFLVSSVLNALPVSGGTINAPAGATPLVVQSNGTTGLTVASNSFVGVGTNTPQVALEVRQPITPQVRVLETTSTVDLRMNSIGGAGQVGVLGTYSNHPVVLYTNSAERMRIDTAGRVTMPFQPAFIAALNGNVTNNTSPTRLTTWTRLTNTIINARDGGFNTSTGRFTAPVSGLYLMGVHIDMVGSYTGNFYMSIGINGGNRQYDLIEDMTIASNGGFFATRIVPMEVNDYAEIYMLGGVWTLNGAGNQWNTRWEGFLVS